MKTRREKSTYDESYRAAHRDKYRAYAKAYYYAHREKVRAYQNARLKERAEYLSNHKEEYRTQYVLRVYKLPREDFDTLLKNQGGSCAICGSLDWGGRTPHIDHDHKSGKVRGILCQSCNLAVGFVRNSPEIATAMAKYLGI